jgi:hypothetical protein
VRYNGQDNIFFLYNNSKVHFIDCKDLPSDPMFERFGSMEMTRGWIEEGGEISVMAKENLKLSIGRQNNDKYNLKPKLLITCNPKKNWIYREFYLPFKEDKLSPPKIFIPALVTDNVHAGSNAVDQLDKIKDKATRQRLRYGNWEYTNDNSDLCSYDSILDCFTNDHVKKDLKYISTDLAMQGRDKFIIGLWEGLRVTFPTIEDKSKGKEIEESLRKLSEKESVARSKIIADSDGLGNYLGSYMKGIKEFHANSTAINKTEFANIKSECAFKLAELINQGLIYIDCNENIKDLVIEELECLKRDAIDKDTQKKKIISKDKMKELIGRSPDFLDVLIMRMYFEIKPNIIPRSVLI